MSSSEAITQSTFDGLAFPVAKVRYTGSGYSATIVWDRETTFRARISYDHSISGGARQALGAALKAHAKLTAEFPTHAREQHIAIPGDLDADHYTFTFVPVSFFAVSR